MESTRAAARPFGMRLLGPNSLGVLVPTHHMNASYAHMNVQPGKVAFVGQSGMLGSAIIDWAAGRGLGFSYFLTLGDTMDVDLADVVDYLAGDRGTKAVLLHIEHLRNPARFISAVRAASRNKPVLIFKSSAPPGFETLGEVPGVSHPNIIWAEVFRRAGVFQVTSLERLFDALETLTRLKPIHGKRLAIMANGIGPALLAYDK